MPRRSEPPIIIRNRKKRKIKKNILANIAFNNYRYGKVYTNSVPKGSKPNIHARFCVSNDRMIYHPMTAERPLSPSTTSNTRLTRRR